MELDPDDIFKDDEDDPDSEFYQVSSLFLVSFIYLFDLSFISPQKMKH